MMQQQYYNPYYPEPMPQPMPDTLAQLRQPMMQPQMPQNSMVWVSNEQEARNYLVAPNSAVALWDNSGSRVYLKQTDASGKPMFKGYDLVERTETASNALQKTAVSYVTRDEFDALAATVREMKGKKMQKEDGGDE